MGETQKAIYEFIKKYIKENSYPPTIKEIATGVNLYSTSTVHGHLIRLEKQGYIWRDKTKPRAMRILK